MILVLALLLQDPEATIRVVEAEGGAPVFARVVLTDPGGKVVGGSGYTTLSGRFVPPEGWKVRLAPGRYRLRADAGYEFFAHDEEWTAAPGEKKVALGRWVNLRKEGWVAGGDHNHLTREGSENKNYGGTPVTVEFAAAAMASRGWSFYAAGGGGPWILEEGRQTVHGGRRTEAACEAWNRRYGGHLTLWWNNEEIKSRYGHVWFLGRAGRGITWPYSDRPADGWWSLYDGRFDTWQQGDVTKPLPAFQNDDGDLPPVFDCVKSWRDQGFISVYAHPTRTFHIGKNRVTNIAVSFPFDLLAGAPVGGLVIMGDHYEHAEDQALWFAALNEGFRVPGLAENDTAFGRPDIRLNPYVTYTHLESAAGTLDLARVAEAVGAGRNFVSSGAFCMLRREGSSLRVRAYASADPADALESLELVGDGRPFHQVEAARGKRSYEGTVPLRADKKWVIAKALCKKSGVAAITNPVYFGRPPGPLRAAVSGKVTRGGKGVPAEVVVLSWGKEVARGRAAADGSYALEGVPISAHLRFSHEGSGATRVLFFDDPEFKAIHERIFRTEFVGAPGALAGCFPPDFFALLRRMAAEVTIDAELK